MTLTASDFFSQSRDDDISSIDIKRTLSPSKKDRSLQTAHPIFIGNSFRKKDR